MNQIANVVFAYSPKNDDELELTVGDKIAVIGIEEEGWWKGRLKGKTGVFPSNFVQLIESTPSSQNNANKLNSLLGPLLNTKNSISSNSLNNISANSGNLKESNSTSNNNLIMNNTQQQELGSANECPNSTTSTEEPSSFHNPNNNSNMLSERRPKPLWGIGYGDIFAAGAKARPLPADPPQIGSSNKTTAMASERLSTTSLAGTLQKPIPKKPPPPAPADVTGTNGSPPGNAPALPPKPSIQYNPFMQQNQRPLPQVSQQRTVIERVQVIYAYKPSNSDELEMEVGDIIDVLDKNIEDQGWWKGEIKGRVGVFPDNFVQPLTTLQQQQQEVPAVRGWQNTSKLSTSIVSNQSNNTSNSDSQTPQNPVTPTESTTNVGRIKSVFAGTPKGFSKELESNLERHGQPGSFLSLKRSELQQASSALSGDAVSLPAKNNVDSTSAVFNSSSQNNSNNQFKRNDLHQQASSGLTNDVVTPPAKNNVDSTSSVFNSIQPQANNQFNLTSTLASDASPPRQNGYSSNNSSSGKLNHITATRAKGPTRRPPKNLLNKRNQLNDSTSSNESKPKEDIAPETSLTAASTQTSETISLPQNNTNTNQDVTKELNELRMEIRKLQQDFKSIKVELKACQSASESQRKYIKDLVTNLADERKKIAAMQVELDRNLK